MADPDGPRRVPWAVALAAVLAVVGAAVGLSAFRAQQQARQEAELSAARTAFAEELASHREALATPARAADDSLAALQLTLQEHLTVSDRGDDEIAADRTRLADELERLATDLRAAAATPIGKPPDLLRPEVVASLLDAVTRLDEGAIAVADGLGSTAAAARAWGEAVERLRAAGADFVAAAERGTDSDDPEDLLATWRTEREALDRYEREVDAVDGTAGLEPLVDAHREYVDANRSAIDELIRFLEADEIEAYNTRLDERFGGDDPFGFDAAITAAATEALGTGAPHQTRTARQRVIALLEALEDLRRQVPDVLSGT